MTRDRHSGQGECYGLSLNLNEWPPKKTALAIWYCRGGLNIWFSSRPQMFLGPREVGLQAFLNGAGGGEADGFGSFDLHFLAGLWVAAGASFALGHFECAEADELHGTRFLNAFGDRSGHGVHCVGCSTFRGFTTEGGLDGFDKLSFIHGS